VNRKSFFPETTYVRQAFLFTRSGFYSWGVCELNELKPAPARAGPYLARFTDLMVTTCSGTSLYCPLVVVLTAAILSTTSIPTVTLPNTE
jgi:hypothetical protein